MRNLLFFALLLSLLLTSQLASAQISGRRKPHQLDKQLTIYTSDEFRPAYARLVQLLETANYQVIAKDSARMPRQHTVTLKRVSPGMPEFTLYLYLTMYHRFGATYLNISGYCRGPGRLDGHSVFYLKEDSDNKYAPVLHVLWKEMEDAAASYPDGIVLYSNVR